LTGLRAGLEIEQTATFGAQILKKRANWGLREKEASFSKDATAAKS